MSYRKRRTRIEGQFAPRTIEMLRSPALAVASLSARRVLDRLEIELADHGGTENGRLPVTYDDFCRFGLNRHAVGPAIRELVALGFVEVTERGGAGNSVYRRPNLFRLCYRHSDFAPPTDEWRRIETLEAAKLAARQARSNKGRPRAKKRNSGAGKRRPPVLVSTTKLAKTR